MATPEEISKRKEERRAANEGKPMLWVVPASVEKANEYVANFHRQHHPAPRAKFAIACIDSTGLVHGVALVGNPLARAYDDGVSAEVLRCCTDGTPNAPSILYAAAWKACRGMGVRSLYTYTLGEQFAETGGSLRAVGWRATEGAGGAPWNHATRSTKTGVDRMPPGIKKVRWEVHATDPFPIDEIVWPVLSNGEEVPSETLWGEPVVTGDGLAVREKKAERARIRNSHNLKELE